jgi:hypothetical protein
MLYGRFADAKPAREIENAVVHGPRVLCDEITGDTTIVEERRADRVTGARSPTCLIFSTERGFMRLWDYPANWHELTDAELVALSERKRISKSA